MKKKIKILLIGIIFLMLAGLAYSYRFYKQIYTSNIHLGDKDKSYLYLPSGSSYSDLQDSLSKNNYLIDQNSFEMLARIKNLPSHIRAGRYLLKNGMSNNALINRLRSGQQAPVRVTFNNLRTSEQLAGRIAMQIEADSVSIIQLLYDRDFVAQFGFDTQTIKSMFLPNTYEFYWNTNAEKFIQRMHREYQTFWTDKRHEQAAKINLSAEQVSVLASIVQAEQAAHNDEKARVAGLYINRLQKRMLLQSDPTLVYAIGDFTIKRVLNRDKEIESPYNTYKYTGLPPAPINFPELSSIDAVLNYEKHAYIFMCAKDDFSGYHYFSKTNAQHEVYARRYQKALNKQGIRR